MHVHEPQARVFYSLLSLSLLICHGKRCGGGQAAWMPRQTSTAANMLSVVLISKEADTSDANLLTSNAQRNMQNGNEKLIWLISGHFGWRKTLRNCAFEWVSNNQSDIVLKGPVRNLAHCVVFALIKAWYIGNTLLKVYTCRTITYIKARVTCRQLHSSRTNRRWESRGRRTSWFKWWRSVMLEKLQKLHKPYSTGGQQAGDRNKKTGLSQVVGHNGWFYFACCKL